MSGSQYPHADLSGANLERSGVYREQALAQYPDLRYTSSTRWDRPRSSHRERLVLTSSLLNIAEDTVAQDSSQQTGPAGWKHKLKRLFGGS